MYVAPYLFLYQALLAGMTDYAHFSLLLIQIILAWVGRWFLHGRFLLQRRYALLHGRTIPLGSRLVLHSALLSLVGPVTE